MRFTFRVKRDPKDPAKDVITEAKYLTFGCTSAIAASEALCVLIEKGHYTPIDALKIKNKDIVDFLEGLPEQKIHCSVMGAEALEAAVFDWAHKRGVDLSKLGIDQHEGDETEGRLVCKCFNVTEPYLRRKIQELKLHTIADITNAIKAGGACMTCHHAPGGLQDVLNDIWGAPSKTAETETPAPAAAAAGTLSPFQFNKKVEKVIEEYVQPMLKRDGGGLEVVDIKDKLVYCRLQGACKGCAGARMTLKSMVERALRENVDEDIRVIEL